MKLHDALRQLKKITPDEGYSRRSLMRIVGMPVEPRPRLASWSFFMHHLQIGSAIALTSLLLIVGFGGFSAWKLLSPFHIASLDVVNLEAEAEAINDIQVRLLGVTYVEPPQHITSTTPRAAVTGSKTGWGEGSATVGSASTGTEESVSIDETLDILSE